MAVRLGEIHLRRYPLGPGMILVWVLGALGMGVAVYRWIVGLGATTNLSDGRPWGLWISFDMMSGIGLAAGAFTLAAIVYIFNLKKFYPIVRPTILTGFISYTLAALTLLVDLSQPQRIWHLIIYWNVHSPLFEIGWCVMLYLTVLALEFSPVVFEALGWKVPLKIIRGITIPLIIAGVTLSTMHQSTLGTMLTILPDKIHPLFYSRLFPLYFYLTAIAAGLAMTVFESYHSSRTYGYPFEIKMLSKLVKGIPWVLGLYFVIRMAELFITGNYRYLLEGGAPAVMYIIEMIGGVLIPIFYFSDSHTRNDVHGITWGAFFTMGGLILNRVNAALIFMDGSFYLPSWQELAVTVGLTCLGLIMFDAAVRFLPMFPEPTPKAVKRL
ncbi:MAG: NrfD/PsrC family molybdoenzyme membrane anchor subunit [Bellilinea sp.]